MNITDWIGSVGVFMILLAYFLNINNKISSNHPAFILLNLVGASLSCLASVMIDYLPFVILEGAWALVSVVALLKYLKANQKLHSR